ncbi:MAG TPA: glycosyltransferase family 2 protein [Rugosimonospora sp.]|nr:glycosyltransferase family 2 protein [Rugosimonospora sp.]
MNRQPLVSVGLPVRNAADRVTDVVKSVLAQEYPHVELVISDNASTDGTQDVCRSLADADSRIRYHRQPQNIGLLNNFGFVLRAARGEFFRWIGDDDRLASGYLTACLSEFAADPHRILVTTGMSYMEDGRPAESATYHGTALGSADPVTRLEEMLRLLNESHLLIDPLYALVRRKPVAAIPRRNMLREDEVFAAKLALAGPWGHIPDVLAERVWGTARITKLAERLDVPSWQSHFANTLQAREMLRWIGQCELTADQKRRARAAVYRMYLRRQGRTVAHRSRKLLRMATTSR